MFSILDRYISKTILSMIGITLFLLVSLSTIIRFIEQLRSVRINYDATSAILYSVLLVPKDIEVFFPISALIGALIGLGFLASRSELVVMESSGFSRIKIILAVMKTAIPLVLIVMAIGEWVSPMSEQLARNMRYEKLTGGSLITSYGSLWAKDDSNYVHIGKVNPDGSIQDVDIYSVNENKLLSITHATRGVYEDKHWKLSQAVVNDFTDSKKIKNNQLITMSWDSPISPETLTIVAQNPESLSASGLYQYAQYLESSGQDATNYQLLFWKKLLKPLSVAVMMLLALSFIFGPLRSVQMGIRIITGVTFGFLFYISDSLLSQLTIVVGLPPLVGAMITSILFLGFSYYFFKRKS